WGFNPVIDLSGHRVSALHALGLSVAALAVFSVPLLSIASFGIFLSAVTRSSAAAIVGTLVYELVQEAVVGLVHWQPPHHHMLSAQFDAWHGVFQTPVFWPPVVRALWSPRSSQSCRSGLPFWCSAGAMSPATRPASPQRRGGPPPRTGSGR